MIGSGLSGCRLIDVLNKQQIVRTWEAKCLETVYIVHLWSRKNKNRLQTVVPGWTQHSIIICIQSRLKGCCYVKIKYEKLKSDVAGFRSCMGEFVIVWQGYLHIKFKQYAFGVISFLLLGLCWWNFTDIEWVNEIRFGQKLHLPKVWELNIND